MAFKRKSSTRKKKVSSKKTTARKQTAPSFSWKSEVLLFVVLLFSVILFLTNIGKGGVVGEVISRFFFGVFGWMAYAFPFVLFFLVAFLIANIHTAPRKKGKKKRSAQTARIVAKIVSGVVFYLFLCVFFHLVCIGNSVTKLLAVYQDCAEKKAGGGLIGAAISNGLIRGFGLAAAYIITIIVLVLCVVLITEKSLFRGVFSGSRKVYHSAKEDVKVRRQQAKERQEKRAQTKAKRKEEREKLEQEKLSRLSHKVSGVSLATDLKEGMALQPDTVEEPVMASAYEDASWEAYAQPASQTANAYSDEMSELLYQEALSEPKKRTRKTKPSANETAESDAFSVRAKGTAAVPKYIFPDIRLLKKGDPRQTGDSRQHLQQTSQKLQQTLETFGVAARVTNVICGPAVTQYEIQPEMGVKVSKILNLADDIKLNLMVPDIRIEAPIPGKAAIGIEVPNRENVMVSFRDLIESREFRNHPSKISFCAGKDIAGNIIIADIAKMPHLLIAGATGSGKSVCINTIIMSILFKADPSEVKLLMIDPKVVELSVYNNIPHLISPVVTDPKKAAGALQWAVAEMTDRYNKFAEYGVRDMKGYNAKVDAIADIEDENKPQRMAQIVVIVDELADLMMVAAGNVEESICRLAQLARAAGIHLIIATQRPSVNVITGLIKANMPSRIAFSVTSGVDSRTILDMNGAEKLLGKGDMLYYPQGIPKPLRVQGAFVSDTEVSAVVQDIIEKNEQVSYNPQVEEKAAESEIALNGKGVASGQESEVDEYFMEAARLVIEAEEASAGMLQRTLKIGFNRAARLLDELAEAGIISEKEKNKQPRRILVDMATFEQMNF